jgi:integrase
VFPTRKTSKRMAAFLQCLKETYADPGEALGIEWRDIKGNILTIAHPCKGHLTGEYEISSRLLSMLNNLPKKDKRIFPAKYSSMLTSFTRFKKRLAVKLQRPEILEICFKSFRHWGGTTIAESTDGNVLIVQRLLRHKCVLNTMKYIHARKFEAKEFEETTATTVEEIRNLGKTGWAKYDEMTVNGIQIHFYRRPKRFGGV